MTLFLNLYQGSSQILLSNWQQIQKCTFPPHQVHKTWSPLHFHQLSIVLAKKRFKISKEEFESIVNLEPETGQTFLFRFYEFVTGQKPNIDRRLASTLPQPEEPLYKQPTASFAAKDRELHRIVDLKEKEERTMMRLTRQKNMIHTQKYNTGLI